MNIVKKKRGNKVCPECFENNGPRSFNCKHCDYSFPVKKGFRKTPRKKEVLDWTNLKNGDIIRVIGGSGSYYEDKEGDRHYLTDRGLYTVLSLVEGGINVRSKKGGDKQFLYMGPTVKSNLCFNLFRSAHKIVIVSSNH